MRFGLAALVVGVLGMMGLRAASAEQFAIWQTDANGLWTEPYHWTTPSYPANNGTNLYSANFDMPTRTVTLATNVTLENFTLSRGQLAGSNSPALWLNGQFRLGTAQLAGGGWLSASGLTITGATKVVRSWTLENRGAATWLGGDLRLGEGARLLNATNGEFNAACDGTLINDLGGTATLENAGVWRKSSGTGQTKVYLPFLNTGMVEAAAGELDFYGNTTNLGAHLTALAGGTLTFSGTHHVVDSASIVDGQGTLNFDNGTVDFDGTANFSGAVVVGLGTANFTPASTVLQLGSSLTFARSGTLNLNSGETLSWNTLTVSNGTFNGSDRLHSGGGGFRWLGGTLRGSSHLDIDAGSTWAGGTKVLRGWTVENHGAMQWSAGDISCGEGCQFVNQAGASLQTSYDGNWQVGYSGGALLANFGAIQKSAGTNATLFSVPVYNEGLLEVVSGTVRFANALTNRGALAGHAGTKLAFAAPRIQLSSLGSLDSDGTVVLEMGSVVDSGAFRAAAGLTVNSGTLQFTNTSSRPEFGAGVCISGVATLDLGSGYALGLGTLVQTNGTLTGADPVVISNQWVCANGDLEGSGLFELHGQSLISGDCRWGGRRLENYGTLEWASGSIAGSTGLTVHNAPGGVMALNATGGFGTAFGSTTTLLNEGTTRRDADGTNQLNLPFVNLNGQLYVNAGRLQFNGGFTQTNGLLMLNHAAVGASKALVNDGGDLAGSGDIWGSVLNAGRMLPGWDNATGRVAVSGNYTQAVAGTFSVQLADTNQFDVLSVTGQASLAGKLQIGLLNGFVPSDGVSFPVLTCGSRSGQFAQITGADLPQGRKLVPVYSATGVSLVVSNTLPVLALSIEPMVGTNAVRLSWPAGYPNVRVQSQNALNGTNWTDLALPDTNWCLVPITAPAQFFRLRQGP